MFPKSHKRKSTSTALQKHPLYEPSIYTYTCRGVYYASSENTPHEGICRGFHSRLELLSDLERNSRKGALEDFTYWAAGGDMEGAMSDLDEGGEPLDEKTKSVLVSPALIYKDLPGNKKKDADAVIEKDELLPEEELITRQNWTCYGSTQVDYLLLRDPKSGQEKIAAVAPRNNGLTIRKIEAEPGNSVTCIGLGWLSIVMDSVSLSDTPQQPNKENNTDEATAATPEEVPPKPNMDTLATAKASANRTIQFASKVGEHMKSNVSWLWGTLQDDFPARTWSSGQRILHHIPVTVDRTAGFMKKMVGRMIFDDDHHDDDDHEDR